MTVQVLVWVGCVIAIGFAVVLLRRGVTNTPAKVENKAPAKTPASSAKQ
jgi:high-affinity Fe2+/Pb2+ permease